METTATLLRDAAEDGILLYTLEGRLKANAAEGSLTDAWKQRIVTHKDALLAVMGEYGPAVADEQALKLAEQHWMRHLTDIAQAHALPMDCARPDTGHSAWASIGRVLPVTSPQLEQRAARAGIASADLMLGTYALFVARWSGQHESVIGVRTSSLLPDALRTGWDRVVDNTLSIRCDYRDDDAPDAYLAGCGSTIADALAQRVLPLGLIQRKFGASADLRHSPLFQIGFSLRHDADAAPTRTGASDLELAVVVAGDALRCTWHYDERLFDARTIERMAESFDTLFGALCEVAPIEATSADGVLEPPVFTAGTRDGSPDTVATLPLLGTTDRGLLASWQGPLTPPPFPCGVHHMFVEHARRDPNALALVCAQCRISYGELDRLSNRFAARLLAAGVLTQQPVGICMERSADWIIAVLGILKAGAAYLPLDPKHPIDRLRYMIADSGARIVATHVALQETLDGIAPVLMAMDADESDNADVPALCANVRADQLAYIVYTSGSTGLPKGVMITHAGATNLQRNEIALFDVGPASRVLQFSSISFDVATWDWTFGLTTGASLFVCTEEHRRSPAALGAYMVEEAITHAMIPPALLAHLDVDLPYSLEYLMVIGEALEPVSGWRWARRYPLINAYGPSEASVVATVSRVLPDEPVTIGRALKYYDMHILDARLQPVPIGVVGELVISGIGVGIGYVNRPELNAEKFIGDLADPMRRAYRTGDLVRFRLDGEIEFLGRMDDQVKIRGYRIELGEINTRIKEIDGVREAFTVAHGQGTDKRLIAYVAPAQWPLERGEQALAQRIRAELEVNLPEYMLPAGYVFLQTLPVNVNGKVDKKQLPAAERGAQASADYVAPHDARTAVLCDIWQQVLKIERVGIHDRFFAIGGDSILLIQAVARANQAGIAMTARHLHEHQTIAEIAAVLAAQMPAAATAMQETVSGELPLLPLQRAFLAAAQDSATEGVGTAHHFNQSILFDVPVDADEAFLRAAVAALYTRHDALRLRFERIDGAWRAHHAEQDAAMLADSVVVEALSQDGTWSAACADICDRHQSGMDLGQGPLIKLVLFAHAQHPKLFVVAHHLVIDGVSWRVLLDDLQQLLDHRRAGSTLTLARKVASLQAWSTRLAAHARNGGFDDELAYWRAQYAQDVPSLPCDFSPAIAPTHASDAFAHLTLSAQDTADLLQRCGTPYRTGAHELLLAAVALGLRDWSGADAQRLTLEGHGREALFDDIDPSQAVGWFTSAYPLTLSVAGDDIGATVRAVKEAARATPRNGIGHGWLSDPQHDADFAALAARCAPQVLFNYLGRFDDAFAEGDGREAATAPQGFWFNAGDTGRSVHPQQTRGHALGVNILVSGGICRLTLDYSRALHSDENMQRLVAHIEQALQRIMAHCLTAGEGVWTPSDFPLANVSVAELDNWQQCHRIQRLYPATPMQKGMLFHTLIRPDAYVTQTWPVFAGDIDSDCLRRAWQAVVDKYDIFRTVFVGEIDCLHQLVVDHASTVWHEEDWRGLGDAERDAAFARYREDDRRTAFDIASAPLQRISLLRLADQRWCMLWTNHHMLFDGWCLPVIYSDLMAAYAALRRGEVPALGDATPYEDYIAWLAAQDTDAAMRYWRERLEHVLLPTPLLTATTPVAGADANASWQHDWTLDADDTARLLAFAQANELTLFSLIQLAWACLLSAGSGLRDVVYGATVSGRPAEVPGIERMVGLFINSIPVRATIDAADTVADAARRLQDGFRLADHYSYVALGDIQKQCLPAGRGRLFDSLVIFENYPLDAAMGAESHAGLAIESVGTEQETNFAVTISAMLSGTLQVRMVCRAAQVPESMASDLRDRMRQLLCELPRQARIADVCASMAGAGLPLEPCATEVVQPCVIEQIEAIAARHPDARAAVIGDHEITYSALVASAHRLALYLRAQGVGDGAVVGVLSEASPALLVAVLGIMKAGAAYLPLDPSYPQQRLQKMLDSASPALLLTAAQFAPQAAAIGVPTLTLDDAIAAASAMPADDTVAMPHALAVAYVIFTSGSTGTPKGVQVQHAGLANLAARICTLLDLGPSDRVLQFTPTSFDVSVQEIFSALVAGAQLVFLPQGQPRVGSRLVDFMRDNAITVATLPPMVLTTTDPVDLPRLRLVVTGAETVSARAVATWGEGRLFSYQYGPTEATVTATAKLCVPEARAPSIGRTIGGVRAYIVDAQMRPVAAGVTGELLIGGVGLARGYLGDPVVTATKFVPDPFVREPGARMYRTGDLVRLRDDGDIEFAGRNDNQVKVRGYRIELGDVESALMTHPDVMHAIAVVLGSTDEERRLVAYAQVADPNQPGLVETLRDHMRRTVANYMCPGAIVPLAYFPIDVNGKIDKSRLPLPYTTEESVVAPLATGAGPDVRIAAIFAEVIGVPAVDPDDNFFDVGGDSLLAVKVASRINERMDVDINVALVFEAPTARRLAERLPMGDEDAAARLLQEIEAMSEEDVLQLLEADAASIVDGREEVGI